MFQHNTSLSVKTKMKIAYYMPFKPMGHQNPSGDLITGTEIFDHLQTRGHDINPISSLRLRWAYYRPTLLFRLFRERNRLRALYGNRQLPNLWLTYHSYYKAPDLLGPSLCHKWRIPYVIFQGIYSTKRKRRLKTLPGFLLNRRSLLAADHIFTNKQRDLKNLRRLIPNTRLSYIAPGIHPGDFAYSNQSRQEKRTLWHSGKNIVIMTAAMMRPGVKTSGILQVIRTCGELHREGLALQLVVVGDGECRQELEQSAQNEGPPNVLFTGKIPRKAMYKYYSSADIFAFPGIEESLGMVFLEAQSCGLPVVAYGDWGGGEAVLHNQTGLLNPAQQPEHFTTNIRELIENHELRRTFSRQATNHIRDHHDLLRNYEDLESQLLSLIHSPR